MDIHDNIKKIIEEIQERFENIKFQLREEGFNEAWNSGIDRAINAMIDAKIKDDEITMLVAKHWDLRPSEASMRVHKVRQVLTQRQERRKFIHQAKKKREEIRKNKINNTSAKE